MKCLQILAMAFKDLHKKENSEIYVFWWQNWGAEWWCDL